MSAVARHGCSAGPRIFLWDSTDDSTTPVRISSDARTVSVNWPEPDSTALYVTNYSDPAPNGNRAERRAAKAQGRKGRK